MSDALISLRGVRREFRSGEGSIAALLDIDLDIAGGEFVAIVGASGSGKSTLMNILGCLDQPTSGEYRFAGRSTATLTPDELRRFAAGRLADEYAEPVYAGRMELHELHVLEGNSGPVG